MIVSRILDIKRMVLISPEFLVCILVLCLFYDNPYFFEKVAVVIKGDSNVPDVVSALPFSFVAVSYHLGMGVIRPGDEEENKTLYEWPYYWMLEHRFYGSLVICILCSLAVIWFYVNPMESDDAVLGMILVASISISATTVSLLAIAKITLRKLMTLYR